MERLWAPWRIEYIEGTHETASCIFCDLPVDDDEERLVVARGEHAFTIMNRYPYTNGHVMVVPYRHVGGLSDLTDEERLAIMQGATDATTILGDLMRCDGYNLGMNLGKPAGAGIAAHLHLHVVPRWNGDTNFMTVMDDTRVISEALVATYRKLRERYIVRGLVRPA